jgi:hypothetical protein
MRNIKFLVLMIDLLLLYACSSAQSTYPFFLGKGNSITTQYTIFEIQTRSFKNREMISIGLNLEGKAICFDRKFENRLCSKELKSQTPSNELPKELQIIPGSGKTYSEKEEQEIKIKLEAWNAKIMKESWNPWFDLVEKGALLKLEMVAIDSNNQVIPFVWAGEGAGYCSGEDDQFCSQFALDEKNTKIKSLEGVTLKAVKIKSVEGELKVSNIYVVGPYRRD